MSCSYIFKKYLKTRSLTARIDFLTNIFQRFFQNSREQEQNHFSFLISPFTKLLRLIYVNNFIHDWSSIEVLKWVETFFRQSPSNVSCTPKAVEITFPFSKSARYGKLRRLIQLLLKGVDISSSIRLMTRKCG